jgi:hypothetical protein
MFSRSGRYILSIATGDDLYAVTCSGNLTPVPHSFPGSFWTDAYPSREAAKQARLAEILDTCRRCLSSIAEYGDGYITLSRGELEQAMRIILCGHVADPESHPAVRRVA